MLSTSECFMGVVALKFGAGGDDSLPLTGYFS